MSLVEVTFCVPVCYNPAAVAALGAQVERAMQDVQFGTDGQSPCNIFVVHEAEAQAMQALRESLNELEVSNSPHDYFRHAKLHAARRDIRPR